MISRKLQDLPSQSLPREKLIRQGRHSLSNAELLAIFLRMGIKGKNVLDMSSDLIQAAGIPGCSGSYGSYGNNGNLQGDRNGESFHPMRRL